MFRRLDDGLISKKVKGLFAKLWGFLEYWNYFSNWKFRGNGSCAKWTSQFKGTMDPTHTPLGESNMDHLHQIERSREKGSGPTAGGSTNGARGSGAHQSWTEWHSDGQSLLRRA
jgi:hypothetical protein